MTKLPPQSKPHPEPQSGKLVAWTPSEAALEPIIGQSSGQTPRQTFNPRRAVDPDGAAVPRSSTDPITLTQTSYAPTEAPLEPLVDQEVEVSVEPVSTKRPSLLSRLKTRIDEEMPDNMATARKPFLMGLLAGIVLMLLLGQIFRATQPDPTFASALPPSDAGAPSAAPAVFLDRIPNRR